MTTMDRPSVSASAHEDIERTIETIRQRDAHQPEFIQAAREVLDSLGPVIERHKEYREASVLQRIVEPERVVQGRGPWLDDNNTSRVNRGFRVQFNSAIGPYKGGLRFHPSVNLSILKFLAFEQIFKNSLTGQMIGGGKGGADFDPKGKSNAEVMRFCQSFMTELARHIGADLDVPAGDIGVGGREIGFLFGQYKRLRNEFTGVLTGKPIEFGGSLARTEATGYGSVYFAAEMLEANGQTLEGKRCAVSGSGNVAQYTMEKVLQLGGTPITASDSGGWIHDESGIDREKLDFIMDLKNKRRGRIHEYAERFTGATYHASDRDADPFTDPNPLWAVPCDCAFPSATQNELNLADAKALTSNGCKVVCEGANMPCTAEAVEHLIGAGVLYGPGKAANAAGVGTSALEMAQNSQRESWTFEQVDARIREIMKTIHRKCLEASETYSTRGNYADGANIAGFIKVADAMVAQGCV